MPGISNRNALGPETGPASSAWGPISEANASLKSRLHRSSTIGPSSGHDLSAWACCHTCHDQLGAGVSQAHVQCRTEGTHGPEGWHPWSESHDHGELGAGAQ